MEKRDEINFRNLRKLFQKYPDARDDIKYVALSWITRGYALGREGKENELFEVQETLRDKT